MNPFRRVICKFVQLFFELLSTRRKPKGTILMLHWVGDDDGCGNSYHISKEEFKALLQWLKAKNMIRLEDWETESDFYALSIDDVPDNFYHNAFPILKEMNMPFTIFVNVSLLDKEGYLSSEQLKEIANSKLCTVGSHGVKHDLFHRMTITEARKDLEDSKSILESLIGKKVDMYAFPYGSYYACGFRHKSLVANVYKYGFSTVATYVTDPLSLPKYFIPRVNVDSCFIKKITNE